MNLKIRVVISFLFKSLQYSLKNPSTIVRGLKFFLNPSLQYFENKGKSLPVSFIDSNGKVKKKIPLGEQVVFKEKIILGGAGSFYTKYGDVFASLCFVILLFINPVLLCLKK